MKRICSVVIASLLTASLSACGDGTASAPTQVAGATANNTSSTCSLRSRQDFAFATLNEWYLFPETLPASLDPTPFTSVQAYIDTLTATARSQKRDVGFTFITSIAAENAFFASGSSAGFGIRLMSDSVARRVLISEAFEGGAALAAGIDRGDEIIAAGTSASDLRLISDIIAAEGLGGVTTALGPSTAGTTRLLRILSPSGTTRDISVTKSDFSLTAISSRYGVRTIDDSGRKIGYLNLRTFISSADPQLRAAFDSFRAQGVREFVIDFRYNGGGLVSTANLIGDLLGANRSTNDVFSNTVFRPEKSSQNSSRRFSPQSESVAPVKIAFITSQGTASASELVINSMIPYLGTNMAMIGGNTLGKPVGQIGIDRAACDDRIRVVAFSTRNAANGGDYFNGLAPFVSNTCQAGDDLSRTLGDPAEASTRQAVDFLNGRSCTPIGAKTQSAQKFGVPSEKRELLMPDGPSVSQREVPGLF